MHKYHSFHLPPVDSPKDSTIELLNEQKAQEYLIEISKNEDSPKGREAFWREISSLSLAPKRYDKGLLSLPKKRQSQMPSLDLRAYQRSHANANMSILNTTRYMVIDDRSPSPNFPNLNPAFHREKATRKAKYLFGCRNRAKGVQLRQSGDIFSSSFYCSRINPQNYK